MRNIHNISIFIKVISLRFTFTVLGILDWVSILFAPLNLKKWEKVYRKKYLVCTKFLQEKHKRHIIEKDIKFGYITFMR